MQLGRPVFSACRTARTVGVWLFLTTLCLQVGCWAPLCVQGIPATQLPDTFRIPMRTGGYPLNFASLTIEPPQDYILGPNDQLDVTVGGLMKDSVVVPMRVQVMANGMIQLPLVGPVKIGNTNLIDAQRRISDAYSNGYLENPQVNLALAEKGSTSVIVLGEVNSPGAHLLPKYQNDVGHALAAAGGLSEDAADEIEIHRHSLGPRQLSCQRLPNVSNTHDVSSEPLLISPDLNGLQTSLVDPNRILRIPLRIRSQFQLSKNDITLADGDVIVVPSRKHEVFFVVGKLSTTNTVRFTIGDRERELGVGFVLPRDREIDVVTAVVMAGYIDPIDSPTTVTLHRIKPDGTPMLILVDLIEARCNPRATVLVEPGDIIYLNPDAPWYMRRTIDRIFPEILLSPYNFWIRRSIIGTGNI